MAKPNEVDTELLLGTVGLRRALQAYYDEHQANGCKCELCKNAEGVLAWGRTGMEAEKQKPDK